MLTPPESRIKVVTQVLGKKPEVLKCISFYMSLIRYNNLICLDYIWQAKVKLPYQTMHVKEIKNWDG